MTVALRTRRYPWRCFWRSKKTLEKYKYRNNRFVKKHVADPVFSGKKVHLPPTIVRFFPGAAAVFQHTQVVEVSSSVCPSVLSRKFYAINVTQLHRSVSNQLFRECLKLQCKLWNTESAKSCVLLISSSVSRKTNLEFFPVLWSYIFGVLTPNYRKNHETARQLKICELEIGVFQRREDYLWYVPW